MRLTDPDAVRAEYATEHGLSGRKRAYRLWATGPDAPAMTFNAIAEVSPRRVLEVGCGEGELAERVMATGVEVTALDTSKRMIELARSRGVDARLGDVVDLPFGDGEFDAAVAAWMLFHVADVSRALSEIARVLRPGGRLVAGTNGVEHMRELRVLVGLDPDLREMSFSAQNGEELLLTHFASVEIRDARGTVDFPTREAVTEYVESARGLFGPIEDDLPTFDLPFVVTRAPVIFVATKA